MLEPGGRRLISLDGVRKRFGKQLVLDGVTFSVPEGEIFGLVGPLGCGKTTTMRVLATLLVPDDGSATIGGFSVAKKPREVRRMIGYLPQRSGSYKRQTTREFVEFCAGIHGVALARRPPLSAELLEVVGLADRADDDVTDLSVGEHRRLGLAGCLVHDPAVLLLDEPLTGLDVESQDEVRALVVELGRMGKTAVVTGRDSVALDGMCTSTGALGDLVGVAASAADALAADAGTGDAAPNDAATGSAP